MKLHQLPKSKGVKRGKKRLGQGHGSGHGKTSGRGHKGSKARSGYSIRPTFEGGQMPLARKLPKRGFNNKRFAVNYSTINLADLEGLDISIIEVDAQILIDAGLIRSNTKLLKVLGDGELARALTVTAHAFSTSAESKINAVGGKTVTL